MEHPLLKRLLNILIAMVWLINGLCCKVLNMVPRHQLIVARILGDQYAAFITPTIGILETGMFVWVLSGIKSRWCAWMQIILVITMNIIEFILAPDLLLFGRLNAVVAIAFVTVIYLNEYSPKLRTT